jgi:hypothetical protein
LLTRATEHSPKPGFGSQCELYSKAITVKFGY